MLKSHSSRKVVNAQTCAAIIVLHTLPNKLQCVIRFTERTFSWHSCCCDHYIIAHRFAMATTKWVKSEIDENIIMRLPVILVVLDARWDAHIRMGAKWSKFICLFRYKWDKCTHHRSGYLIYAAFYFYASVCSCSRSSTNHRLRNNKKWNGYTTKKIFITL